MRSHTLAQDAGKIATAANVGALALNHLIPSDDPDYGHEHWQAAMSDSWQGKARQGKLIVGSDGLKIKIGQ